jgi:hypothetical protein
VSSLSGILLPKGEGKGEIVKLKMELESLKARCTGYEGMIRDLESRCDTYERELKIIQQHIVHLYDSQGTLNTIHHGENYELMP